MHELRIGDNLSREDAICVAGARRHEAVRGEHKGSGDVGELLLLILPCGAKVALELRIALELGIGVGGQHLAVRIDVDACALGLLEEQLEVVEVMAGNDDEGALLDLERDLGGLGHAVGASVGCVEQAHHVVAELAHLH